MHFDIFNGDADGICALHQLRLANPKPGAQLITGVKRDVTLLAKPELSGVRNCSLTVLDISLDSNKEPLNELLAGNNTVTYVDHHAATSIPLTDLLETHIIFSPDTCTSLIVNTLLENQYSGWAVCGAFGDNLHGPAQTLAAGMGLSESETDHLRQIGELLNYNGYGSCPEDLHYHPEDLYLAVQPFSNPLDFYQNSEQLSKLQAGYSSDLELALQCDEHSFPGKNRVFILPDEPWARRVSGVFANLKAREKADSAHALVTENSDGTVRISVRAPLNDKRDAVTLCKQFPTGGGRAAAAGINSMPESMLDDFLRAFNCTYP